MDSLPPLIQVLAEEVSSLVLELSAGLLERPAPLEEQKADMTELCERLDALLTTAIPAIQDVIKEINALDPELEDYDELAELVDDLSAPALDLVSFSREIWESTLPKEHEGMKPFLARLAEVPAVELLGQLQPLVHAALDPISFYDEPEKAKLALRFSGNYAKERAELAKYCQQNGIKIPASLTI